MAKAPKLAIDVTRSIANSLMGRLSALIPNLSSDLSPVLVYTPGGDVEEAKSGTSSPNYGWTAPDINGDGTAYTVQVECYGAGGGGGGGTNGAGGGGGAGGEYACEEEYPVEPGETYSYFVGGNTQGGNAANATTSSGDNLLPGANGADTHFDYRGKGITGGVLAHGGQGGDQNGVGTGGRGGTGSVNTIHFDGGDGASPASGVASDNPGLGLTGGSSGTVLNWRMDDKPGTTVAFDYSTGRHNSSSILKYTGAIVQPTTEIATPVQVPFGSSANWDRDNANETAGACWKILRGTSSGYLGGIVAPSFTLSGMTSFTVSCWIKGAPDAVSASDWGDNTSGIKVIVGNKDVRSGNNAGWCMYMDVTNNLLAFQAVQSGGANQTITCTAPAANDGNWHMCTAVFQTGSNNFKLYLDGVLKTTLTASITSIAAGTQVITVGLNKPSLSNGYRGYVSNLWLATLAAPLSYIQFAYGTGAATGGGGGGASGGSAGTGNAGGGAVGATGGAAGASAAATDPGINNGSCAGGAGGNSASNGSNADLTGPPTGGGGGGSGSDATVTQTYTAYLPCNMSGSYTGFDADGAAGGALYTVSADPQADVTSPWYSASAQRDSTVYSGGRADSPFQGSMFSILTFPSFATVNGNAPAGGLAIPLNNAAWSIDGLYLELTVNTENAANVTVSPWWSNTVYSTVPDTLTGIQAIGYSNSRTLVYVPEGEQGRRVILDLFDAGMNSDFVTKALTNGFGNSGVGVMIGELQGSDPNDPIGVVGFGSYDSVEAEDWYCAFTGADTDPSVTATLIVKYHATATSLNHGGQGSPGYIAITYIDPKGDPVTTILPVAGTDDAGNALAEGITTSNIDTWKPGSNPKTLETWTTVTYVNSWTAQGAGTGLQYRLLPDGKSVRLTGRLTVPSNIVSSSLVIATLPLGYRPLNRAEPVYMMGHNPPPSGGTGNAAPIWGVVQTNGDITVFGSLNAGQQLEIAGVFPLDAG